MVEQEEQEELRKKHKDAQHDKKVGRRNLRLRQNASRTRVHNKASAPRTTYHVLVRRVDVERQRERDGAAQARKPQHDLHLERDLVLAL